MRNTHMKKVIKVFTATALVYCIISKELIFAVVNDQEPSAKVVTGNFTQTQKVQQAAHHYLAGKTIINKIVVTNSAVQLRQFGKLKHENIL